MNIRIAARQTLDFPRAPLLPGLLLSAALAAAATRLGAIGWLSAHGLGAVTLAIVLGMLLGNTVYGRIAGAAAPGVEWSRQTLLRAGIVLYGLRLTLHDVGEVGVSGVVIDAITLLSTFLLALFVGRRLLGVDGDTAILVGAGSAICGAAAVLATEPVLRAKPERVTVAVATVVTFGTLAVFVYPALYVLQLYLLPHDSWAFGVYAGSTIHEVAQVFAAARAVGPDAADAAVITKMVRVMMLAPFLLGLSAWLNRSAATVAQPRGMVVPWFALGFAAMVVLNSVLPLPAKAAAAAVGVDGFLLAMAMAALGLTTHVSAIRKAGARPLLLATILFAWLIVGGALINTAVSSWL